ncbi:hypothetical protein E2C01_002129 [Portunus trituberculatus]|uniref:Uncharacterized protein n=1 Tax=Portunus trituberculatus TaxID=210409 RepID=A0A5B7CJR5_PORTR|nr:hypothetical protein [Portunus trituberculatus]
MFAFILTHQMTSTPSMQLLRPVVSSSFRTKAEYSTINHLPQFTMGESVIPCYRHSTAPLPRGTCEHSTSHCWPTVSSTIYLFGYRSASIHYNGSHTMQMPGGRTLLSFPRELFLLVRPRGYCPYCPGNSKTAPPTLQMQLHGNGGHVITSCPTTCTQTGGCGQMRGQGVWCFPSTQIIHRETDGSQTT